MFEDSYILLHGTTTSCYTWEAILSSTAVSPVPTIHITVSSLPTPTPSPPRREANLSSSTQSTPRPASRRSNISSQIYQFGLGYPQTPPETSPILESPRLSGEGDTPAVGNRMGSFLFKWCVWTQGNPFNTIVLLDLEVVVAGCYMGRF